MEGGALEAEGGREIVPVCVLRYLPLPLPREKEAGKKGRMKENTNKNKEREDRLID